MSKKTTTIGYRDYIYASSSIIYATTIPQSLPLKTTLMAVILSCSRVFPAKLSSVAGRSNRWSASSRFLFSQMCLRSWEMVIWGLTRIVVFSSRGNSTWMSCEPGVSVCERECSKVPYRVYDNRTH